MKIIGGLPYGELEPAKLGTSPDGWDTVTWKVLAHTQNELSEGSSFNGDGITGSFYLQSKNCVGFIGCEPIMEYTYKGIHGTKDYIISGTGATEIVSGEFSGIPDAPTGSWPANVKVTRVGVTVRYFSNGKPDCSVVGSKRQPPEHFGEPAYPFGSIVDAVYSVPYGWVLDNRLPVQLPGTARYAVTDEYGYYWRITVPSS